MPTPVHRAIVQARDGAVKYVLRNHDDSIGHNLLGLLYELEGMARAGERSLRCASDLCHDGYHGDGIRINHARLLRWGLLWYCHHVVLSSSIGQCSDALTCYNGIDTDLLGLTLVLFKLGRTNEALSCELV